VAGRERGLGLAQLVAARQYRLMADEPENLTLVLLREMRAELADVREQTAQIPELRAEQHALANLLGKVADAVTEVAKTQERHSQVLARHSELLGQILETQQSHGARLNGVDSRLAIIERHTGLVKA
jgi:uncharacterized protein YciW